MQSGAKMLLVKNMLTIASWLCAAEFHCRPKKHALWMGTNYLYDLICRENLTRTLETGVTNGLSTLAMTLAVEESDGHHIGIDPCRITDHNEVAVVLLEEFGIDKNFSLMAEPSHMEMPKLMEQGKQLDLIFVDGMHLITNSSTCSLPIWFYEMGNGCAFMTS